MSGEKITGEKRKRETPAIEMANKFFKEGDKVYNPEDPNYGNFELAEKNCQNAYDTIARKIDRDNPNNLSPKELKIFTLSQWNLGLAQFEQNKFPEAEKNLGEALFLSKQNDSKYINIYKQVLKKFRYPDQASPITTPDESFKYRDLIKGETLTRQFIRKEILGIGSRGYKPSLENVILRNAADSHSR